MAVVSRMLAAFALTGAWTASAISITFTDLNPVGATSSGAYGISGARQVGYAMFAGEFHAALWYGSSNSFVDLHPAENFVLRFVPSDLLRPRWNRQEHRNRTGQNNN